jgi:hypothetical protein
MWTLEEILECQKLLPDGPSEQEVIQRYEVYGGIPRSIFSTKQEEISEKLHSDIARFSMLDHRAYFKVPVLPPTSREHPSHSVVHLELNMENFRPTKLAFNSDHIAQRVLEEEAQRNTDKLIKCILQFANAQETRQTSAQLYDMLVKGILHQRPLKEWRQDKLFGTTWNKAPFAKEDAQVYVVKHTGQLSFKSMVPGVFYVPQEKNFPLADVLLRTHEDELISFNATMAQTHSMKGLRQLMKKVKDFEWVERGNEKDSEMMELVGKQPNFHHIWVVPSEAVGKKYVEGKKGDNTHVTVVDLNADWVKESMQHMYARRYEEEGERKQLK